MKSWQNRQCSLEIYLDRPSPLQFVENIGVFRVLIYHRDQAHQLHGAIRDQ